MPSPAGSPSHVTWLDTAPTLRSPVLIAAFEGWNDAGDAATLAARHVADRWDANPLAEIDAELFYDFSAVRPLVQLDEDRRRTLTWPTNLFRAATVPGAQRDVVVLVGLEPQLRWRTFCEQVTATAQLLGVSQVITLGALLADVPHTRPVEVYGATDDDRLMAELELSPSTYEGPTGIVGVLSSACRDAGIPTASFWSAVPSYVPGAPSPKAALSLVPCSALPSAKARSASCPGPTSAVASTRWLRTSSRCGSKPAPSTRLTTSGKSAPIRKKSW